MKYLKYSLLLLVFMCFGCEINNTPTSKVDELFNKYQMVDDDISLGITNVLDEQNYNEAQRKRYRAILERQYRDLSYEIKEEKVDGDEAVITVEIEVYDYKKAISNLTYDSSTTSLEEYNNKKLDLLEKAKDKVVYTLDIDLSKDSDGKWKVNALSNANLKKIQGMY